MQCFVARSPENEKMGCSIDDSQARTKWPCERRCERTAFFFCLDAHDMISRVRIANAMWDTPPPHEGRAEVTSPTSTADQKLRERETKSRFSSEEDCFL